MSMSMDIRDDVDDDDGYCCRGCGMPGCEESCAYAEHDYGTRCDCCHSIRPCTLVEDADGVEWDICDECLHEPVELTDDYDTDWAGPFTIG